MPRNVHAPPVFLIETFRTDHTEPGAVRRRYAEELNSRVKSITMLDADVGMDEIRVTLDNSDGLLTRNTEVAFGRVWGVSLGYEGDLSPMRWFRIVSMRGYREMEVRGLSMGEVGLNVMHRTEEWTADRVRRALGASAPPALAAGRNTVTRAEVVMAVAKEANLLFDVRETLGEFEKIVQANETDAQFVTKLADQLGFVWWVDDYKLSLKKEAEQVLHFRDRDFAEEPSYGFDVNSEIMLEEPQVDMNIHNIPAFVFSNSNNNPFDRSLLQAQKNYVTRIRSAGGNVVPQVDLSLVRASSARNEKQQQEELDGLFKKHEDTLVKIQLQMRGDPMVVAKRICVLSNALPFITDMPIYISSVKYELAVGQSFKMTLTCLGNSLIYGSDNKQALSELYRLRGILDDVRFPPKKKEKKEIDPVVRKAQFPLGRGGVIKGGAFGGFAEPGDQGESGTFIRLKAISPVIRRSDVIRGAPEDPRNDKAKLPLVGPLTLEQQNLKDELRLPPHVRERLQRMVEQGLIDPDTLLPTDKLANRFKEEE